MGCAWLMGDASDASDGQGAYVRQSRCETHGEAKKACVDRNSPTCTLSQNGYGGTHTHTHMSYVAYASIARLFDRSGPSGFWLTPCLSGFWCFGSTMALCSGVLLEWDTHTQILTRVKGWQHPQVFPGGPLPQYNAERATCYHAPSAGHLADTVAGPRT